MESLSYAVPAGHAMRLSISSANFPEMWPTPQAAVTVLRQALASQPDGSVVMIGIGYEENIDALLNSPPDSISPLSGSQLDKKGQNLAKSYDTTLKIEASEVALDAAASYFGAPKPPVALQYLPQLPNG